MRVGPKYKICKRLGSGVFEKCQTQKFMLADERRNKGRRRPGGQRGLSEYGKQLLEKQKIRYTYGLSEKQLARYAKEAGGAQIPTQALMNKLESRLDNAVYRLGLAHTRRLARQLVAHGHVLVNQKKVKVPSYSVTEGDSISIREGSRDKKIFENLEERLKDHAPSPWISFDHTTKESKVKSEPTISAEETPFDVSMILEYYSR